MTDKRILINLERGRRRLSLGRIGWHDRYLAHAEPDGTIVLTPATVSADDRPPTTSQPAEEHGPKVP